MQPNAFGRNSSLIGILYLAFVNGYVDPVSGRPNMPNPELDEAFARQANKIGIATLDEIEQGD